MVPRLIKLTPQDRILQINLHKGEIYSFIIFTFLVNYQIHLIDTSKSNFILVALTA